MYLLGKRADSLNAEDIKRLVDNKFQENKSLDYKRELRLLQDKDKKEFLFDITSMSNTDGGCFVFGIQEGKDEKGQNTGTPEAIVGILIDNYDKLSQQIEDLVRANSDPSITNILLNHINIDDKSVLVIGIPKSLGFPIMVTFNETNKFYKRRNSGKYTVDVFELNQMFMQNQILKKSAEKFRHQRINNVRKLKVFPNLQTETSFFIHIIPFSFLNDQTLDLTDAEKTVSKFMNPLNLKSWDAMFNVDGFATWSGSLKPQITSYDQLFRNGIYEVYTSTLFEQRQVGQGKTILCMYGLPFIPDFLQKVHDVLTVLKMLQVEPPFIVSLSMLGMKGAVIYSSSSWGLPFLVNKIYFPSILIQSHETDLYKQLKPTLDMIWQSVSENQSPIYSK